MKNVRVYIYPDVKKSTNNYITYFHESFNGKGFVVNNRLASLRLLNIIFNLDSDIFIFHWVDAIPHLKYGFIQVYFFKLIISFLFFLKKEIIWVLHNKISHKNCKESEVNDLMDYIALKASKILVHAAEGIDFCDRRFNIRDKVVFINHPFYVKNFISLPKEEIKWDYIIWGTINRYKKIDKFLDFINSSGSFADKKILICGKCLDIKYDSLIKSKLTENIDYLNEFLSDSDLDTYISKSKIILFTYNNESVLSSGALIHSLPYGKLIIGPNVGNFKDYTGFVKCFNSFDEILSLSNENEDNIDLFKLKKLIKSNSWDDFSVKLLNSYKVK